MEKNATLPDFAANLKYVIDRENVSVPGLSELLAVKYSTFRNYLAGTTDMPLWVCANLLRLYPWVSPDWFILGVGSPERQQIADGVLSESPINYANNSPALFSPTGEKLVLISEERLQLLEQALRDKNLIIQLMTK